MSLRYSIANLYKDFPSVPIEDLQGRLEKQKENAEKATWLPKGCSCDVYPSILTYIEDGIICAEFGDFEELCGACQDYFTHDDEDEREEQDSRLLKEGIDYLENTFHSAIVAKKKGYDTMTQEQLEAEADSVSQYEGYLNRSQTNFLWSNQDTPSGLLNEIDETEEELDAIQFEINRRKTLGQWATASTD
jgi:hypothetical protein